MNIRTKTAAAVAAATITSVTFGVAALAREMAKPGPAITEIQISETEASCASKGLNAYSIVDPGTRNDRYKMAYGHDVVKQDGQSQIRTIEGRAVGNEGPDGPFDMSVDPAAGTCSLSDGHIRRVFVLK